MLSQTAWKIGRAFTTGRAHPPSEFQNVEVDINALAKALKLLAEALFADSDVSLLTQADLSTQHGMATILNACSRAIYDLESLVDQYQVVKKTRTQAGFTIERSWSDLVLTQYQTMMWTTDGGSLQTLRHLLQMHTTTINLVMQAVQRYVLFPVSCPCTDPLPSKSPSHLEQVVLPVAEQVDSIQHRTRTLSQQLNEANRVVKDIASKTAQFPPTPNTMGGSPSPLIQSPLHQIPTGQEYYSTKDLQRAGSLSTRPQTPPHSHTSPEWKNLSPSSPLKSTVPSPVSNTRKRISDLSIGDPASRASVGNVSSDGESSHDSRPSLRHAYLSRQPSNGASSLARSVAEREARSWPDSGVLSPMLPPPALTLPPLPDTDADAASLMSGLSLTNQPAQPEIKQMHRSSMTLVQKELFEKVAFRNSAILCDV